MQLSPNEAELALRDELRAFLARHQPAPEDVPHDFDERVTFLRAWQKRLHEAGLVGLSWPREHGGRGATLTQQIVANQELARAGAPTIIGSVGLDVVGPSLIDHGTRRAEGALPRRHPLGRRHLVPGLLRGRRRLGPRVAEGEGRRPRRPLRPQRPQGVDLVRPARAVVRGARPHRPRRARPPRHLLPARRHEVAGHRGAAARAGHRRPRVRRGLLRRRRRAERPAARPAARRVEDRDAHARARARVVRRRRARSSCACCSTG